MTREAALHTLLSSLFSAEELRTYLALQRGGMELVTVLPGSVVSSEELTRVAVEALSRRGLVDGEFFENLEKSRPNRIRDIHEVRARWPDAAGSVVSSNTIPSMRRSRIVLAVSVILVMLLTVIVPKTCLTRPFLDPMVGAGVSLVVAVACLAGLSALVRRLADTRKSWHPAAAVWGGAAIGSFVVLLTPPPPSPDSICDDCELWCIAPTKVIYTNETKGRDIRLTYEVREGSHSKAEDVTLPARDIVVLDRVIDIKVLNTTSKPMFLTEFRLQAESFVPLRKFLVFADRRHDAGDEVRLTDTLSSEKLGCSVSAGVVDRGEHEPFREAALVSRKSIGPWQRSTTVNLDGLGASNEDLIVIKLKCWDDAGMLMGNTGYIVAPLAASTSTPAQDDQIPDCESCSEICHPVDSYKVFPDLYDGPRIDLTGGTRWSAPLAQMITTGRADWLTLSIQSSRSGRYAFTYSLLAEDGEQVRSGKLVADLVASDPDVRDSYIGQRAFMRADEVAGQPEARGGRRGW